MTPDIRLAYDTCLGRASYIGGSGLRGEAQYTLPGRPTPRRLSHRAVLAMVGRRRQQGRTVPVYRRLPMDG